MKQKLLYIFFFTTLSIYSQSIEILGKVTGISDLENIHVMNTSAQSFTITDKNGEFKIPVKLNDTLMFSSIQYKLKDIVVTHQMLNNRAVLVKLDEHINTLDEVVVGSILTGNLLTDINNMKGDGPINFYDVGIPGYTGKIATQSERRLSEASDFKPSLGSSGFGLGASVGFTPIINAITGRTKKLKNRVKIEEKTALMERIKSRLSKDFFASNPLDEDYRMDFFYFCSDDVNFLKRCKNQDDFKVLMFLRMKYKEYTSDN
ncbi:carboxypeptidase-like regulatory domain-containing protein [Algibacter pacificus]|uniref:carboxypeptidase-like regulatory domain-containing protein n=1 Tax=Algibacter pacificus TaxID=2599389 RepID=UPI0011CB0EA7|nr:carboxypeptidase-like regulatory domain-containing protein [Algibacter pacificus]